MVSIVIPVYNAQAFIIDCLNSVSVQTFKGGIECILVDDCGIDDSVKIIEQYIADYKGDVQFKLLHQEKNQGPSAARNRGVREASGEYVFFLDADDAITPICIEKLYALASKHQLDYVQGTYGSSEEHSESSLEGDFFPAFSDDKRWIKRTLLDYNKVPFTPHNRLVRRGMLLEHDLFFNEEIRVREDFLWMTFVAKYVDRFGYCSEVTYIQGYNAESLTHHIDVEREIKGYKVLIEQMCIHQDPLMRGAQKVLALDAFIMVLNSQYYHNEEEKQHLLDTIKQTNTWLERMLLSLYMKRKDARMLHLLNRLYQIND